MAQVTAMALVQSPAREFLHASSAGNENQKKQKKKTHKTKTKTYPAAYVYFKIDTHLLIFTHCPRACAHIHVR